MTAPDVPSPEAPQEGLRRRWLAALAGARPEEVEEAWRRAALDGPPAMPRLRPPEIGLVMVRGRAGGTGRRFNLGEAAVTRCAVRGEGGIVGQGYVLGRDARRAELIARLDALLQEPGRRPALVAAVVEPLERARDARRREEAAKAAATRVEFFTLQRGDGA